MWHLFPFSHVREINVWHRCSGPCCFGVDITQNRNHVVAMQFFAADVPLAHDTWLGSVAQRRRVRRIIVELDQIR